MGNDCFYLLGEIEKFDVKNLKEIVDCCFFNIKNRKVINAPKLRKKGKDCFVGKITIYYEDSNEKDL